MPRNLILAIDQGTSGTKTALFDPQGRIVASAAVGLDIFFPKPGFVEQDPRAIYQNVIQSLRSCLARFKDKGGNPADIAVGGLTNQRETFLLWDEDGEPLSSAVSWQCARSAAICRKLVDEGMEQEIGRITGLRINPYFSGTKLLWLMENDPKIAAAVRSGAALFGTVDTWLLYRLTGGRVYATDYTNASRTLLFNIDRLCWDVDLLHHWGLDRLRLPALHPSQYSYGETDFDGTLPMPVAIGSVIGDSHAAAFGERCLTAGSVKATVGTGSSILMSVGPRRAPADCGMISTICWSTTQHVEYALEGIIISAGSTIAWLRDQVGLFAGSDDTEAMSRKAGDNGGVYIVPAFSGMGAPYWRTDLRASIKGLSFASTRDHIARAALESIPFQIAMVLESMRRASGVDPEELKIDGGITSNAFVMQFLADLLDIPVVNDGIAEVSALGAALLAGLSAGLYRGLDDFTDLPVSSRRYVAEPGSDTARLRYAEWKSIMEGAS
jgi:glycerol kinase